MSRLGVAMSTITISIVMFAIFALITAAYLAVSDERV